MKISDRLSFESEGTELLLRDGEEVVCRVDCVLEDIARDAAEDYTRQMIEGEEDFEGTVEDAIEDARRVMHWTRIFSQMGAALGRKAAASERLSRSPM